MQALSEITVDLDGNYRQKRDASIQDMIEALSLDRLRDLDLYRILRTSLIRALPIGKSSHDMIS
jgi:hypothetical protein